MSQKSSDNKIARRLNRSTRVIEKLYPRPFLVPSAIMHFIRRAAFRAASSSPSTSFVVKSRSATTVSPFALRTKVQSPVASTLFRRFNSDDAWQAKDEARKSIEVSDLFPESEASSGEYGFESGSRDSYPQRDRRFGVDRAQRDSAETPRVVRPSKSVYVGNILFDLTAEDLKREFEQFGEVVSSTIIRDARGLSKGYGYVEFKDLPMAEAAIAAKHQTVLEGRRVVVSFSAKPAPTRVTRVNPPSKTLFIGSLAYEMSDADLNKLFRDIKNVIDVRVAIDRRTGQPRGFAHADFVDIESAEEAMEQLQGKEVYGRKLRIDFSAAHIGRPSNPRDSGDISGESSF